MVLLTHLLVGRCCTMSCSRRGKMMLWKQCCFFTSNYYLGYLRYLATSRIASQKGRQWLFSG